MNGRDRVAKRQRLDQELVSRGLVANREQAHRYILAGRVSVDGVIVDKRAKLVERASTVNLNLPRTTYVSRAGEKLAAALDFFDIHCAEKVAMDVGASTGGFTDCLLQNGVAKVYAIDVGYGLLEGSLRNHTRVIVMDRFHVKDLTWESLSLRPCNLFVVMDLSFISLRSILPVFYDLKQKSEGIQLEFLSLCKPQFELEESYLEKGVVRKNTDRFLALVRVSRAIKKNLGGEILGIKESPLSGAKGNREIFIYWKL